MNKLINPSNKRLSAFKEIDIDTVEALKNSKNPQFSEIINEFFQKIDRKLIAIANIKGGVGKSTLSNIFQGLIDNSVIINIDLEQDAEKFNSLNGKTINFVKFHTRGYDLKKIVEIVFSDYDTIIIDSPGKNSKEFLSIVQYLDHLIVPVTVGNISVDTTKKFLKSLFMQKSFKLDKISIIINNYKQEEHAVDVEEELREFIKENKKNIKTRFYKIPYSKTIYTMEKKRKNLKELHKTNPGAYRIHMSRMMVLVNSVKDFYENKLEVE